MTDLERITKSVEERAEKICRVNDQVWEYAELAFHEFRSADTICQVLEEEGFTVERGLAGIPTCFTGTYVHGSGKPVMGILGEFDALSSLSQQAATNPTAGGAGRRRTRLRSLFAGRRLVGCRACHQGLPRNRPPQKAATLCFTSAVLPKKEPAPAVYGARRTV